MRSLVFYDPLAQRGNAVPKDTALSDVRASQRGRQPRKWRRGPNKRQLAKSLVLKDLHLLASRLDSSGTGDPSSGTAE